MERENEKYEREKWKQFHVYFNLDSHKNTSQFLSTHLSRVVPHIHMAGEERGHHPRLSGMNLNALTKIKKEL